MKQMIFYLLLAGFPALILAQQKKPASSQEQLKIEMKRFQEELQSQLKTLQDSVAKLRSEVSERDHKRMKEWDFHHRLPEGSFTFPELPRLPDLPPLPDIPEMEGVLDNDFENEGNWDFRFEMPPAPCQPPAPPVPSWNYEWDMPQIDNRWFHREPRDWHFDLRIPQPPIRKHRHHYEDILETLPFYRLFKS